MNNSKAKYFRIRGVSGFFVAKIIKGVVTLIYVFKSTFEECKKVVATGVNEIKEYIATNKLTIVKGNAWC